jgi:hypothetical protein
MPSEYPLDHVAGVTPIRYGRTGKKVKLETQNHRMIVVQIWAMTVTPAGSGHTGDPVNCYVGHEIAGDPVTVPDGDQVTPDWHRQPHSCTFNHEGGDYTVITHKDH